MRMLKLIFLAIIQLVVQVWFLPRSLSLAFQHRRQRIVWNKLEAERLDRIRNPSKYLGK